MFSLPDLPPELLDAICTLVPLPDLPSLARVHSAILPIAQRHIYRSISVSSVAHNLGVVFTLAQRPDLARNVRSFEIHLPESLVFRPFYRRLAVALSEMTALVRLSIFIDPQASWVLLNAACPQLQHFSCAFPFNDHVAGLIKGTPDLLHLQVDSTYSGFMPSLPASCVPQLSFYIGSCQLAEQLIPHRPIHSVQLTSGDLSQALIEAIAQSTVPVLMLGASTASFPVPLLECLSTRLPDLEFLRMNTTYNFAEAPGVVSWSSLSPVLFSLSALSTRFFTRALHVPCRPCPVSNRLSCRVCIGVHCKRSNMLPNELGSQSPWLWTWRMLTRFWTRLNPNLSLPTNSTSNLNRPTPRSDGLIYPLLIPPHISIYFLKVVPWNI